MATISRGVQTRNGSRDARVTNSRSPPKANRPLVWLRSWRTVIRSPSGTTPGSHRATVSWSVSLCSATSCRTTVATSVFVMLPTRKRSLARIRVPGLTLPLPLVRRTVRSRSRTSSTAPGAPAATTRSRSRWSVGARWGARSRAELGEAPTAAARGDLATTSAAVVRVLGTRISLRWRWAGRAAERHVARRPRVRGQRASGLLVLERVQDVEARGAPRGRDRRQDAGQRGDGREHEQRRDREVERDALIREALGHDRRQEHAEREPERRADQRRDDALVAHHPASLAAAHADRAQHPELTGPLEHRQDHGVHHSEQAHHDRQREQDVEQHQRGVEVLLVGRDERRGRLELRVRVPRERPPEARAGIAAGSGLHERIDVPRPREHRVERRLRDDDSGQELLDADLVDRAHPEGRPRPARGPKLERAADVEAVLLLVVLVDQCAVAEAGEHPVRALLPVEAVNARDRRGVDADYAGVLAADVRLVAADARRDPDARGF